MAIEASYVKKFQGLDVRPLVLKVLEAKYQLGLSYPQYKAARTELLEKLSKTKEGKEVLKRIEVVKIYQRLQGIVEKTRETHNGLLEAAFPTGKAGEPNLADLGRTHNISRERVRQIVAVIRMMCHDVKAFPTEVVRLNAKKFKALQEL